MYYSKIAAIGDLGPPCSIHKNTTLNRQVRKRAGTARRRQRFDTNYSREFKCLNYLLLFPVRLGCFILTTTGTIIIIIIILVIRHLRVVYGTCENTFYPIYNNNNIVYYSSGDSNAAAPKWLIDIVVRFDKICMVVVVPVCASIFILKKKA